MPNTGIILFAHGSRDPLWRLPFEAILTNLRSRYEGRVELAFLECMLPGLSDAVNDMALNNTSKIVVVPIFLAVGSHVRKDLPELIELSRLQHPNLEISVCEAIGEQSSIQLAIADFALSAMSR